MTIKIVEACSLFEDLSPDDLTKLLNHLRENILATDMARHNDIMNEFKQNLPTFLTAAAADDGKHLLTDA